MYKKGQKGQRVYSRPTIETKILNFKSVKFLRNLKFVNFGSLIYLVERSAIRVDPANHHVGVRHTSALREAEAHPAVCAGTHHNLYVAHSREISPVDHVVVFTQDHGSV